MLSENNITLRQLSFEDETPMALLANNKKIWDNVRDIFPHPYSPYDANLFIDFTLQQQTVTTFAIEYDGEFCGVIGLVPNADVYQQSAEIGYWIGEPFWNKGIASTGVKLITKYGLHTLGFVRLHAGIFEYNIASMKVLEKNGYEKEGISKKAIFKNEQIWNEHRYAIVK